MSNHLTYSKKTGSPSTFSHLIGPSLTLIVGASLSIIVYSLVHGWEESQLQKLFEEIARSRLVTLQSENIRHQDFINSTAMLFSASEEVTREEFHIFAKKTLSRQPGVHGLAWIPLITHSERERYTQKAIDDGFADFQITELNMNGELVVSDQRENYLPVYYLEPYAGNEPALGFNLASHPSRLKAIYQARDTGNIIISERIKLVQEKHDSFGYLLFKAVYRNGEALDTLEQRRKHFIGLADGVFRFKHLMPKLVQNQAPAGMDILILDQDAPIEQQFLHFHASRTRTGATPVPQIDLDKPIDGIHWKTTIKVLNRNWTIVFQATPAFLNKHRSWQSWTILVAGISFSLVLTLYMFASARYATRIANNNIKLLHEVTRRKKNEEDLKTQHDFMDTVFDATHGVIVVLDLEGRIVRFNRATEELTGFTSEELLGALVWELVIPDEQRTDVETVFNHLRNGELEIAKEYENEWLTRDGTRRLLLWHNSVLHDNDGKISHIVAIGYDITEQKLSEKEHQRLQRELQQSHKMDSLGQLTGGIAHDFNNLLGIINGYATLLFDNTTSNGNEKLSNYANHIIEAGERAAKLVAQMLAFSRSDQTDDMPIEIGPLLKEDTKLLRATLPSTMDIKVDIEPNLPAVIMNPIHLHQILMNLSINARDAMDGIGQLSIKLCWVHDLDMESHISHKPIKDDWIELSVSDTGCGIDETITNNIFEPFFTTKEVGKGTGMGLSVIYGIVESHDGHILLESEPGKGSTFRLLFPPATEAKNDLSQDLKSSNATIENDGIEILVVDDEPSLGTYLAELLTSHGYKAQFTSDSSIALTLIENEPDRFSMLITDQTMPKLSGIELITKLRELLPDLPVILCTGYSDKVDAIKAAEMDITFFEKPINGEQLLSSISDLLKS